MENGCRVKNIGNKLLSGIRNYVGWIADFLLFSTVKLLAHVIFMHAYYNNKQNINFNIS